MQQSVSISVITTSCLLAVSWFCLVVAAEEKTSSLFPSLVSLGQSKVSSEGRHVEVNVPPFYHGEVDTRASGEGPPKYKGSVLGGLVRVYVNRKRGANGKLSGPTKVSVFGIPMFDNHESDPH